MRAIALIFFYAPTDADQGSRSGSSTSTSRSRSRRTSASAGARGRRCAPLEAAAGADLESYVAIHQGVIFGALTLITGSIWAKISWGVWWAWSDDQLVLFLVLFLFYCGLLHAPLLDRPGPARANMSAVYALFGVVLIPVSFPRDPALAELHPPRRPSPRRAADDRLAVLTFCVALVAMLSLFATLYQLELAGKRLDARLRELRELLA
jgi:heme exporter protein C